MAPAETIAPHVQDVAGTRPRPDADLMMAHFQARYLENDDAARNLVLFSQPDPSIVKRRLAAFASSKKALVRKLTATHEFLRYNDQRKCAVDMHNIIIRHEDAMPIGEFFRQCVSQPTDLYTAEHVDVLVRLHGHDYLKIRRVEETDELVVDLGLWFDPTR